MAKLNIFIEIIEQNKQVIDDIIDSFKELESTINNIQLLPLNNFNENISEISTSFEGIEKDVDSLANNFQGSIDTVRKGFVDGVDEGVNHLELKTANFLEKIVTRITVVSTLLALNTFDLFGSVFSLGINSFNESLSFTGNLLTVISERIFDAFDITQRWLSSTNRIYLLWQGITASILPSAALFIGLPFAIKGAISLFKTFVGIGDNMADSLTRVARVFSVIDKGIEKARLTFLGFTTLVTGALSIVPVGGVFGFLLSLPAILNAGLKVFRGFFGRYLSRFFTRLGSGQSTITDIIDRLKFAVNDTLPKIDKFIRSADKNLLTVNGLFKDIQKSIQKINEKLEPVIIAISIITKALKANLPLLLKVRDFANKFFDQKSKGDVSQPFDKLRQSLTKISSQIDNLTSKFNNLLSLIFQLSKSFTNTKDIRFFTDIQVATDKLLGQFLDLEKRTQKVKALFTTGDRDRFGAAIQTNLRELNKIFTGKSSKDFEDSAKFLLRIAEGLRAVQGNVQGLNLQQFNKLIDIFSRLKKGTFKIDSNLVRSEFANFVQVVNQVEQKTTKTLKLTEKQIQSTTDVFFKQFIRGFTQLDKTVQPSLDAFTKLIAAYFAKTGNKIPSEIARGFRSNKELEKALEQALTEFMKRLPASPAKLGPLRGLYRAGKEIVNQLNRGIIAGFSFFYDTVDNLLDGVINKFQNILDIEITGQRLNIDSRQLIVFDTALQGLNSSVQDLSLVYRKVNTLISDSISDEDRKRVELLGINLNQVKNSTIPILSLIRQVGSRLKEVPSNSKEAIEAFELLGVTANSSLINVLKSSDRLDELIERTLDLGITFDKTLSNQVLKLKEYTVQIKAVRESLTQEFLAPLLPLLNETLDSVLSFFEKNQIEIRAYLRFIGVVIGRITKLVAGLVLFLIKEPGKAFNFITRSTANIFSTFLVLYDKFYRELKPILDSFAGLLIAFLLDLPITLLSAVFNLTLVWLEENIKKLVLYTLKLINDNFVEYLPGFRDGLDIVGKLLNINNFGQLLQEVSDNYSNFTSNIEGQTLESKNKLVKDITKDLKNLGSEAKFVGREFIDTVDQVIEKIKAPEVKQELSILGEKLTANFLDIPGNEILEDFGEAITTITDSLDSENFNTAIGIEIDTITDLQTEMNEAFQLDIADEINNELEKIEPVKDVFKPLRDFLKDYRAYTNAIQNIGSLSNNIFSDLYELSGKKIKEFAIAAKATAIGQAIINQSLAITEALAKVPPPLNYIQAGLVAAQAGIQIAKISAQSFAEGGIVTEGTTGTADDVVARVSKYEFIEPANVVAHYSPEFFEALRQKSIPKSLVNSLMSNFKTPFSVKTPNVPKFATGGLVRPNMSNDAQAQQNQTSEINIANIFSDKQIANYMSSTQGKRVLLNFMDENQYEVRNVLFR